VPLRLRLALTADDEAGVLGIPAWLAILIGTVVLWMDPLSPMGIALVGIPGALIAHRLWATRGTVDLLARGLPARGALARRINLSGHGGGYVDLVFTYETRDGDDHWVAVRTNDPEPLLDQEREPLLYDPAAPNRAIMLDSLPGRPRVGAADVIDCPWTPATVLALVGPALTVLVNLALLLR
jgi:hypothetical protein